MAGEDNPTGYTSDVSDALADLLGRKFPLVDYRGQYTAGVQGQQS